MNVSIHSLIRASILSLGMLSVLAIVATPATAQSRTPLEADCESGEEIDIEAESRNGGKFFAGSWECHDTATGAPFLVSFFQDGNLRTSLPDPNISPSHAIWKQSGRSGFEVEGRALIFASGAIAGVGTSYASGYALDKNHITAKVQSFVELLDGTVIDSPSFVLECERIVLE